MTEDSDHSAPNPPAVDGELDEFRALVRAAFEQAQNSGKPNWERMTSAVLKNRLLDITERQFSEARYGTSSFISLVRRVPDLLDIVEDNPPFTLRIKEPIASLSDADVGESSEEGVVLAGTPKHPSPPGGDWKRIRIRDDLWRGIIDYDSGDTYVLDPETGHVRPIESSDAELPVAPTATQEVISSWREEFTESLPLSIRSKFADELRTWMDHGGRQTDLPRSVRGRWVAFLKRKVSNRLEKWFDALGKPLPSDTLLVSETGGLPPSEAIDEVVRTRQLRDLIIRAVQTMSYDELAQISVPAFVLLRVSRRAPRQDG